LYKNCGTYFVFNVIFLHFRLNPRKHTHEMPAHINFRMTAGIAERWNENHAHLMQGCTQICKSAIEQYPGVVALEELRDLFQNHECLYNVHTMIEYRPTPQVRSYV